MSSIFLGVSLKTYENLLVGKQMALLMKHSYENILLTFSICKEWRSLCRTGIVYPKSVLQ